jgi:hypothetical protein
VGYAIHEGLYYRCGAFGQVKMVEQDDVRKPIKMFQAFGVFWEYFDHTTGTFSTRGLYGCPFGFLKRSMDNADWFVPDLIHAFAPLRICTDVTQQAQQSRQLS